MDIVDIMLARALTPQGQIESYAAQSQQAVVKANQAVASVEAAASSISEKQTAVDALLQTAQETLETAQQAQINMPTAYNSIGQNTDGYMTQKAVTDALDTKASIQQLAAKADTSALNSYATKQYVDNAVSNIPAGGSTNLGANAAGKIVIVGADGNITPGSYTEADIANGTAPAQKVDEIIGLNVNYQEKTFERIQETASTNTSINFNSYPMYGGRMRCNVADDGTINAFYGDMSYIEDGSNGQVMVYQPKFYYKRILIRTKSENNQQVIYQEHILLSAEPADGFKLHPLFKNGDEELDYVLLSAYESCIYDVSANKYFLNDETGITYTEDKLSSIAGAKPMLGVNNKYTLPRIRQMAENRGEGWHLTSIQSESASQMLQMVEYGSPNGQQGLGKGIIAFNNVSGRNCASITGSTAALGNGSGAAEYTINESDGTRVSYSDEDKVAISYRGVENPWGNTWRLMDNCTIKGNGRQGGGIIYVDNTSTNIMLPSSGSWSSAMGYSSETYDWLYMPVEFDDNANSALPIGDSIWLTSNLSGENLIGAGGSFSSRDRAGLFFYSCDVSLSAQPISYNGRIMFVPTKNAIYDANIAKWEARYEG